MNTISFSTAAELFKREDTPKNNGLLGLGYPRLTAASGKGQGAYTPFVFNLAKRDIINDPVFSIYMNRVSSNGWVGEILFGGIDETKFKGNLTYIPVVPLSSLGGKSKKRAEIDTKDNYYWMVKAQGIALTNSMNKESMVGNDTVVTLGFDTSSAYVLDTGTTLTYLPPSMAEKVITSIAGPNGFKAHEGSGTYLVDCNAAKSDVQLELIMSDHKNPISLAVPASQLVIPLDAPTADMAKTCLFGIAPATSSVSNNVYLVGDSILRSTYMVFNMGNNQVGLAPAIDLEGKIQSTSFFFSAEDTESSAIINHPVYNIFFICCILVFLLL